PPKGEDCKKLDGLGCLYVPDTMQSPRTLVIYFRGHHPRWGADVPDDAIVGSSRQAFLSKKLGEQAQARGFAVLVTGKSSLTPARKTVNALKPGGKAIDKLVLAAHSGGFDGLLSGYAEFPNPDRLLMLDDFYFGEEDGRKLAKLTQAGASCVGFYTEHNKD